MNPNLYRKASDLEETTPEEALEIYKNLEEKNLEFHTSILLAGIIFPIIAYVISFLIVQSISSHRTITTLVVLSAGYTIPFWILGTKFKVKERRYVNTKTSKTSKLAEVVGTLIAGIIAGILTIVNNLIELITIALYAAIPVLAIEIPLMIVIHFLTGVPVLEALPVHIMWAILTVCFAITFLVYISEPEAITSGVYPIDYFFGLTLEFIFCSKCSSRVDLIRKVSSEILIGLKVNSGNLLKSLASMTIGFVLVGSGTLGIFHEDIHYGIIVNGLAGMLVGLTFARMLKKDYVLGNLYLIGKARCLIRLDRQSEASYHLSGFENKFDEYPWFSHLDVIEDIVLALKNLIGHGDSRMIKENLNEAVKYTFFQHLEVNKHTDITLDGFHREAILDSIQKTRQLVGLGDDVERYHYFIAKEGWEGLVRLGEPAVEPLIQALKDKDSDVRWKAAEALGNIGDVKAVEPLIQALKDEDEYVRWKAAEALGEIGEPAVEHLIQVLDDEKSTVRRSAKEALEKIKKNKEK